MTKGGIYNEMFKKLLKISESYQGYVDSYNYYNERYILSNLDLSSIEEREIYLILASRYVIYYAMTICESKNDYTHLDDIIQDGFLYLNGDFRKTLNKKSYVNIKPYIERLALKYFEEKEYEYLFDNQDVQDYEYDRYIHNFESLDYIKDICARNNSIYEKDVKFINSYYFNGNNFHEVGRIYKVSVERSRQRIMSTLRKNE